jgi:hypothetical protein
MTERDFSNQRTKNTKKGCTERSDEPHSFTNRPACAGGYEPFLFYLILKVGNEPTRRYLRSIATMKQKVICQNVAYGRLYKKK